MHDLSAPSSIGEVVISGASRGLGRALLEIFLEQTDLNVSAVLRNSSPDPRDLVEQSARVRVYRMDLADHSSKVLAKAMLGEVSDVKFLINCAAENAAEGFDRRESKGPIEYLSSVAVDHMFRLNVLGPMLLSQSLLPALLAGRPGTIVNVTSKRGSVADGRQAGSIGYSISKAALNMLTLKMAADLESTGVTVLGFDPGWIRTRMGGDEAPNSPQAAAQALFSLLSGSRRLAGRLWGSAGQEIPW